MARMHSRKKGKSGSSKPLTKRKPTWVSYSAKEIEMVIVKLAKEDKSPNQIGMILRDQYGIPDAKSMLKKRILALLKEKKLAPSLPEDLNALVKKAIRISKHRDNNTQDKTSGRGLQLTQSKIHRLAKYYKKKGVLPEDWQFSIKKAITTV